MCVCARARVCVWVCVRLAMILIYETSIINSFQME